MQSKARGRQSLCLERASPAYHCDRHQTLCGPADRIEVNTKYVSVILFASAYYVDRLCGLQMCNAPRLLLHQQRCGGTSFAPKPESTTRLGIAHPSVPRRHKSSRRGRTFLGQLYCRIRGPLTSTSRNAALSDALGVIKMEGAHYGSRACEGCRR